MLSQFKELFHFYPKKFIHRYNDKWSSHDYYLKDSILEKQLLSDEFSSLGFFNSYNTNFIALDVDNHKNNINIISKIKSIQNIFGQATFVVPSPRGYHLYYLFRDYTNIKLLSSAFNKKLKDHYIINVEVKPTDTVGLRLPILKLVLDPSTLEPLYPNKNIDKILFFINKNRYNTSEFIDLKTIDDNTKLLKSISTSTVNMIENGTSNMYLNQYIPIWKSAGFNPDQCTDLFMSKLSPSYNGPCRDRQHVLKRVKCYFKTDLHHKKYSYKVSNEDKQIILNVVNIYINKAKTSDYNVVKRITSLIEDMKIILYAKRYNEEIMNDKSMYEFICSLYPYHKLETKRGCTPLSSKFLQTNRKSYIKNLKFFLSNNILQLPFGRHYDVKRKSCIYYKVNTQIDNEINIDNHIRKIVNGLLHINETYSTINLYNKFDSVHATITQYNIDFKLFIYRLKEIILNNKAAPIFRIPLIKRISYKRLLYENCFRKMKMNLIGFGSFL